MLSASTTMSFLRLLLCRLALLAVISSPFIPQAVALKMTYCSVLNTASTNANSSIYQSTGLCHDFCLQNYAFAILQDASCWCSNYVPAATSPLGSCNMQCPGYPLDVCGGIGLFGYIALVLKPAGTLAVSGTPTSQSTSAPTPTSTTENVIPTPSPTSSSTSSSSDTAPGNSETDPPSTSFTPIVTVQTITGQVRTVTYMPTASPSPSSTSDPTTSGTFDQNAGSQNLSTGQAVGLTVGLVGLVGLIGASIFFFVRKRRRTKEEDFLQATPVPSNSNGSGSIGVQRAMSQNSRFMLGTDGRQVVEGWEAGIETPGSRRSRLMPVDPRLDPFAPVYLRGDGSKSGDSIQTIQDNHDYSRRVHQQKPILRATNPD